MKRIALFTAALLCGLVAQGRDATRVVNTSKFTAIEAKNAFVIELVKGDTYKVELEADRELIDELEVYVTDNKLHLEVSKRFSKVVKKVQIGRRYRLKAVITAPYVDDIELSGACVFTCDFPLMVDHFEIDVKGSSDAHLTVLSHTLDADASGASSLELKGSAKRAEVDASGSSSVYYYQDAGSLKMKCSGASHAYLKGEGVSAFLAASGSSDIDATHYELERATVKCSGASTANVFVTGTLDVEASGASDVRVKGNPSFTGAHKSGSSDIIVL